MIIYKALTFIHVAACLLLILTVLMQGGRGAGLQIFGGGGDSLINTPSGTSFIKKFTAGLAATFALTSLFLTLLTSRSSMTSVTSRAAASPAPIEAPAQAPAPAPAQKGE